MTSTTECDVTYPPEMLPYPNEGEIGEVIVMTDWADEIVEKHLMVMGPSLGTEMIAALRKAKADGMRECANVLEAVKTPDVAAIDLFRAQANQLDPPTT